jgi:hypothetical protein
MFSFRDQKMEMFFAYCKTFQTKKKKTKYKAIAFFYKNRISLKEKKKEKNKTLKKQITNQTQGQSFTLARSGETV